MLNIYLDTISINKLYELYPQKIGFKKLNTYNYLLSSCQVDELSCIESTELRSQIIEFLFKISDKKKLKDHIEIIASELLFELGKTNNLDYIDPNFNNFNLMLKMIIKKRDTVEFRSRFLASMNYGKKIYQEYKKNMRKMFQPFFQLCSNNGLYKNFQELFMEMLNEGNIHDFLFNNLSVESDNLNYNFNNIKKEIYGVDIKKLTCSFVGIQSELAYSYLSSFERGKISEARISDQVDVRHLFYLNYADVFVTDDSKILKLFQDKMLIGLNKRVETTDFFLKNYF